MFKEVITIAFLLILSGQNAWAENNQQLADIVATDPKAEMQKITSNLAAVIPDLPTSASQTLWNAGINSVEWDEAHVELLVAQVRDADSTLAKVWKYEQQYTTVFKHRNDDVGNAKAWLLRVAGVMFQMKKQAKLFKQRMIYLKKILPQAIKVTAKALESSPAKEKKMLSARLQTQFQCYQAMNFPMDKDIQSIQSKYLL